VITQDIQAKPIPDLSTVDGQQEIERHLEGVELLILDNLSCLFRNGRENEGDSWLPFQEWALSLRKRSISVLFIHHSGKDGQQRGTSRREDILDTVLALKRPGDYEPSDGARFELHYEKSRGAHGETVRAFEAKLQDGGWCVKDLSDSRTEKVAELLNDGVQQKDIADLLNINKGTVSRHAKKARFLKLIKGGLDT
jgi:putative DNA primase/helicase